MVEFGHGILEPDIGLAEFRSTLGDLGFEPLPIGFQGPVPLGDVVEHFVEASNQRPHLVTGS